MAPKRLSEVKLAVISAVFAFFVLAPLAAQFRALWDTDSYMHAAIARHYRTQGIFEPAPWGRFSMTSWGGDKDLLYHVALIPFTVGDASTGARVALAAMNALLIGALTLVLARRETWWALALPWWLYATAAPFFARIVRLRPDVLSLILLLLLCEAAARRRFRLCGLLAAIYTLSYTPFHLMIGLAVVWCAVLRFGSGRWEPRLPAWMCGGVAAGLVLRPHPLESLRLWYAQNVTFYSLVGKLDLGQEVDAPRLLALLPLIVGWLVGMAALWLATRKRATEGSEDAILDARWEWVVFATTFGVFLVLYTRMSKMSVYAYPLALATLLRWRASQQRRIALWAAPALVVSIAIAYPAMADPTLLGLLGLKGEVLTEVDLTRFGRALPADARVAATWSDAEMFAFWAPQGRYLNIYDSTFMYVPYPRLWEAQAALFAGNDPDVVGTMRGPLQSEYLAFDATGMAQSFIERTRHDPRLRLLYGGYNVLLAYEPSGETAFVTDWNGATRSAFVDDPGPSPCVRMQHIEERSEPARLEFAPWGTGTVSVNGVTQVEVNRPLKAILGRGTSFDLPAGRQVIDVTTCADAGRNGFYLVRR